MKILLGKLFPLFYAKSMVDFIRINELFPNLKNRATILRMIFLLVGYFLIFICGMGLNLFAKYQPLIKGSIGEIGQRIAAAFSITFLELFIIRIWLIRIDGGRGSLEQVEFLLVLEEMREDKKEKWIKRSRVAALSLYIAVLSLNQPMTFYQLIALDLDWDDQLIRVAWIIAAALMTRLTVPDLPILYNVITASMVVIEDKAQDFLLQLGKLDSTDESKNKISAVLDHYENLVRAVRRLNKFSNFIVTVGKGLAIPLFSAYMFVYLTPVATAFHAVVRYAATVTGVIYSVRIYVLIGHLSRMTCISNRIYNLCALKAARETSRERLFIVQKLTNIMQDVSAERNHLLFDEFAGKITPLDLVDSIVSTFSFLMLFASLQRSMIQI